MMGERWVTPDRHTCSALPFLLLKDRPPLWWVGFVDGNVCCSGCASKEDAKAGIERKLTNLRAK